LSPTARSCPSPIRVRALSSSICPKDKLDALTQPFVRLNSNPYLSHEGAGLGLAITKSLVELQDGTLEMESAVGRGTTVSILMPLPADQPAVTN